MKLERIDKYRWRVPKGSVPGMLVDGMIFADESMIDSIMADQSVVQVANAATLPGVVRASMAMPDMHFGYGLPIGGVMATDVNTGIISPGGTGYDINCGVRLLRSNLDIADVREHLPKIIDVLYHTVPCGVGSKGEMILTRDEMDDVAIKGAGWAVRKGFGSSADLEHTEANGALDGAQPENVSKKAYERGKNQLGTLGSGNHFLEIQYVDEIYDEHTAHRFGLFPGQTAIMIHTGSRGYGHQICTDYLEVMEHAIAKYHISLPDRQLACAPINSPEGQAYLGAMRCAANFAWANRQIIASIARDVFMQSLGIGPKDAGLALVYDVAHNIVKFESHIVDGKPADVAVHRKGATRAFPPGHPETPEAYRDVGQPVIIPGDMGRYSFVLAGTEGAMKESFGSTCHGAGRKMSRHAAVRAAKGRAIERELADAGIIVRSVGRHTVKEEMPEAYKDVAQVVDVVHNAGISRKVARLRPVAVLKG